MADILVNTLTVDFARPLNTMAGGHHRASSVCREHILSPDSQVPIRDHCSGDLADAAVGCEVTQRLW